MDDLLGSLDSIRVTFDEVDTFTKHPLFSLYKNNYKRGTQEARRAQFLKEQKEKRVDRLNARRGVDFSSVAEDEIFKNSAKDIQSSERLHRDYHYEEYKNLLMMNEWLTDVPDDFADWIAVPCPLGTRRILVVAEKGGTKAFSRRGKVVLPRFPSLLPGGSHVNPSGHTVLDALWDGSTILVIDAIRWAIHLSDCSVEFRFSWLYWKWAELEEVENKGKTNRYPLKLLERFPCSQLATFTSQPPPTPLDGLIFYHRDSLYEEHGRSPLVTWLKPYMLTELLPDYVSRNQVDPYYLEKPPDLMDTEGVSSEKETKEVSSSVSEMETATSDKEKRKKNKKKITKNGQSESQSVEMEESIKDEASTNQMDS